MHIVHIRLVHLTSALSGAIQHSAHHPFYYERGPGGVPVTPLDGCTCLTMLLHQHYRLWETTTTDLLHGARHRGWGHQGSMRHHGRLRGSQELCMLGLQQRGQGEEMVPCMGIAVCKQCICDHCAVCSMCMPLWWPSQSLMIRTSRVRRVLYWNSIIDLCPADGNHRLT